MAVVRTLIGNVRGPQGEDGSSFEFKKTYATIAAMNSDFSGSDTQTGDYVLISAASINDADNGKMYRKGNSAWIYVAKITGPAGATGPAGPLCPLDTSMAVTVAGQAALDAALGPTLAGKLDATGDSANNTVTYTSDDVADGSASAWETVQPLTSEEKHESLFAKISKVVKNVRFLYKLLGTTDISGIGSGTVTDILSALNTGKFDKANVVNNLTTTTAGYALDAREGKTLADNVSTLNDSFTNSMIGIRLRLCSFSGTTDAYAQLVINNPFGTINVLLLTTYKHITGANYYMMGIDNVTINSITFRVYQVNGSVIQSLPNTNISTYSMLFAIWGS